MSATERAGWSFANPASARVPPALDPGEEALDFADMTRIARNDSRRRLWEGYGKESLFLGAGAWGLAFLPFPLAVMMALFFAILGLATGIGAMILCWSRNKPGLGFAAAGIVLNSLFLALMLIWTGVSVFLNLR